MDDEASGNSSCTDLNDTVSVIITCFNQGHFLRQAIESVLAQTYEHWELVLVDDGSTDNTSEMAAAYPRIRYIHQQNSGLSSARNTGIRNSGGGYIVFLDADDTLAPVALKSGISALAAHPQSAFVYGHYSVRRSNGRVQLQPPRMPILNGHHTQLLRGNYIAMHATVMYRRSVFDKVGGFDPSLKACEDYDLFLRITRTEQVLCHETVVAEYRQHAWNMSRNYALMLKYSIRVLRAQRRYLKSADERKAFESGIHFWRDLYGERLIGEMMAANLVDSWRGSLRTVRALARYYPLGMVRGITRLSIRTFLAVPRYLYIKIWEALPSPRQRQPPVGTVQFGDFRRCTPISRAYGFDRGMPIDRYYIERFLSLNSQDIQGRVLEIGDDTYTRKFGKDRIAKSDVFDVSESNAKATIVGDLSSGDHIPSGIFDCIIFTQTLQMIYDARAALRTLYRILKPGGVLLATFPGVTQVVHDTWRDYWSWTFTHVSSQRLFGEFFPPEGLCVETSGNVLTAAAFLYGLSADELKKQELEYHDPEYELLIAVRAVKPDTSDILNSPSGPSI